MTTPEKIPAVFGDREVPRLDGWLTLPEAAELLGVTRQQAFKMAKQGAFKTEHRIGQTMVVKNSEVMQMVLDRDEESSREG